jgi:hypothetical protein
MLTKTVVAVAEAHFVGTHTHTIDMGVLQAVITGVVAKGMSPTRAKS